MDAGQDAFDFLTAHVSNAAVVPPPVAEMSTGTDDTAWNMWFHFNTHDNVDIDDDDSDSDEDEALLDHLGEHLAVAVHT